MKSHTPGVGVAKLGLGDFFQMAERIQAGAARHVAHKHQDDERGGGKQRQCRPHQMPAGTEQMCE